MRMFGKTGSFARAWSSASMRPASSRSFVRRIDLDIERGFASGEGIDVVAIAHVS